MKKFCVVGHPISHSKSPQMHRAAFSEFEIDATFDALDVAPENLKTFLRSEFRASFDGAAITIPHKESVAKYADFQTESAQKIGAANTLFWQKGELGATNTDSVGVLHALHSETLHLRDKKALVLGAGGAARAAVFALATAGARVFVSARNAEKAAKIQSDLGAEVLEKSHFVPEVFAEFDLVLNTTPVGMNEWKSPVPADFWRGGQIAFDAVYQPLQTRFLEDAERAGAVAISGDKMLAAQAAAQFEIWHGVGAETEIFEAAFFE